MTADNPSRLVPKLRFPEFQQIGDWKRDQIGNIASITKGKGVSKADVVEGGVTPCIRYAELYTCYGEVIHKVVSHTNFPDDDLVLSQAEDVIVPASGESRVDIARAACVMPRGVALGSDLNILRSDLYGPFFSYLLNSPLRYLIAQLAQGDTVAHLYPGQLSQVSLAYPSRPEQQKIAGCLGSLDDLIAAERRKLEALRQHKQGLMQQLFPQPGETVPCLRFPEFEDAPEWSQVALGEIAEITLGKMLDRAKHTTGRLLPYLNNASVRWNEVDTSNLPVMFFDEDELDKFGLKAGDVVVCEGGEPGRSAVWDARMPDLKFQKAIHRVRFKVPFDPRILVLYLGAIAGTAKFESLFTGGGIKHLTRETFARLDVPVISLPEQQRIADCLSSLDTCIVAQVRKLDVLHLHKQGLLQQLFPSPEGNE